MVPLSFLIIAPKLEEDDEYNWLGKNMWNPFLLFQCVYMFGYTFKVFEQYFWQAKNLVLPPGAVFIFALLFSAGWPLATYWGFCYVVTSIVEASGDNDGD